MSPVPAAPRPAGRLATLLAVAVVLVARIRLLLDPTQGFVDHEEGFNAAVAVATAWLGPLDLPLVQYRAFCGGCTVDAVLAGALFTVAPPVAAVWKVVPLAFAALGTVIVFRALHARCGPAAAWAAVAVQALPSTPLAWASLRGWGNHVEATTLGLGLLVLVDGPRTPRRAAAAGLLAALALYVSFSAAPYVIAAGVGLVLARAPRASLGAFAAGTAAVALPWGVQWALTREGPWQLFPPGVFALGWGALRERLATLLAPAQLTGILGDHGAGSTAWPGALAAAALVVAAPVALAWGPRWVRLVALAVAAWTAAYLTGPFLLERVDDRTRTGLELRYAVPLLIALPPIVGAAVGALVARGRPVAATLVLAGVLAGGVPAAARAWTTPPRTAHLVDVEAADWLYLARVVGQGHPLRLAVWDCPPGHAACRAVRAYGQGWAAAEADGRCGASSPGLPADAWWAGYVGGRADGPLADRVATLDALDACLRAAGVPPAVRADALEEGAFQVQGIEGLAWEAMPRTPGSEALARVGAAHGLACTPDPPPPRGPSWVAAAWWQGHARLVRARLGDACTHGDAAWPDLPPGSAPVAATARSAGWLPRTSPSPTTSSRAGPPPGLAVGPAGH